MRVMSKAVWAELNFLAGALVGAIVGFTLGFGVWVI